MRALFIEHEDLSKPGLLGAAFSQRGYEVDEFCVVPSPEHLGDHVVFPVLDGVDVLVALGGPWSTYDPAIAPWVNAELELLARADSSGTPVLGVCFGGQLLASAHGGTVEAAPEQQLGWVDLNLNESLLEVGPWFHWHCDRWTVPPGAAELARTDRASEAFVLRRNVALQFHPEVTLEILDAWIERAGLSFSGDAGALRRQTAAQRHAAVARAERIVTDFLDLVA